MKPSMFYDTAHTFTFTKNRESTWLKQEAKVIALNNEAKILMLALPMRSTSCSAIHSANYVPDVVLGIGTLAVNETYKNTCPSWSLHSSNYFNNFFSISYSPTTLEFFLRNYCKLSNFKKSQKKNEEWNGLISFADFPKVLWVSKCSLLKSGS